MTEVTDEIALAALAAAAVEPHGPFVAKFYRYRRSLGHDIDVALEDSARIMARMGYVQPIWEPSND